MKKITCYDHIVTRLSSTDCRKWGTSARVASFTNFFIEQQQFYIRSAYDVSKESHQNSNMSTQLKDLGRG